MGILNFENIALAEPKIKNNKTRVGLPKSDRIDFTTRRKMYIDKIARYCDRCGTPYKVSDLDIVKESNMTSIIHFYCSNCKAEHIATFIHPLEMSTRYLVVSDLSPSEYIRFISMPPVQIDDLLALYDSMNSRKKV